MDPTNLANLLKAEKIGLFDSGLGGLSVLSSFIKSNTELNQKQFIYVGDTMRCPYGNRPSYEIKEFVLQLSAWLTKEGAQTIVMACNTSAALMGEEIQKHCLVNVVNLLDPSAQYINAAGFKRVGVLATKTTASTKAFSKSIQKLNPQTQVFELGCPDLVPLVESGRFDSKEADQALEPYVRTLLKNDVDSIIFGCTHYPFLKKSLLNNINRLTNKSIALIDPAQVLTSPLNNDIFNNAPNAASSIDIVTTGDAEDFAARASVLLNIAPHRLDVRNISIAELIEAGDKVKTVASPIAIETISPSPIP